MVNITNLRAVAERLISENGRTFTLVHEDRGNPSDPTKPWRASTGASDVSFDVIGVDVDYDNDDFDGTLIRRGDKRILAAASAVETAAGSSVDDVEKFDSIVDGTTRWKIVKVNVIQPGIQKVLYDIQVRQ